VLTKIPGSREDVFGDKTIDLKLKRSLMKFLKLAADADAQLAIIEEWGNTSFQRFLDLQYGIPSRLQSALHALTLSPTSLDETLTSYAIPRITRHLTSIGVFGPGFGSVIPKWGGIAEVAQVACRAGAVGGGVYVLDQGIVEITKPRSDGQDTDVRYIVRLRSGEEVRSSWVAGCEQDIPMPPNINHASGSVAAARSISIVSSNLAMLFPSPADGAPPPAVALVVFAAGSLNSGPLPSNINDQPIYLVIHSSETGECPTGQCELSAGHFAYFSLLYDDSNEYLSTLSATPLKITYL
jgi:RAB protein geranylgeranyltransferase component A